MKLHAAEMDYGPEEVELLRAEIIKLRDIALENGQFSWAVRLSHTVALLAVMKEQIWPTPPSP